MELWFLDNPDRLSTERQAIHDLEQAVDWLHGLSWVIDGGLLHLEAIIVVGETEYNIILSYPTLYPDVPAWVKPKNSEERRWSEHQYVSGTLCLEWGQDNWHPGVTGAHLLESTFKLLNTERPHEERKIGAVESRHSLTVGQELRSSDSRLFVSANLSKYLNDQKDLKIGKFSSSYCFNKDYLKLFIQKIDPFELESWMDESIPNDIKESICKGNACEGVFYKLDVDFDIIRNINTLHDLKALLVEQGFDISIYNAESGGSMFTGGIKTVLIIDEKNIPNLLLFFQFEDAEELIRITPVYSEIDLENKRKPINFEILKEKSIGLVGLGSVGSKIAISLARSGISSFYLIDDDVFLPENNCRNALNWRNVSEHKVDSVSYELRLINSKIEIRKAKINLTAQESSSVINSTLSSLGKCDIIIDASGNKRVFNILSSVSKKYKKPLVWGEVFEGGIGGLIARSRPTFEPDPLIMRASFLKQVESFQDYETSALNNYESEDEEGNVVAASDSQVGIIADYITEFAIDALVNEKKSNFPYPMYLIGFKEAWIFKAPFDTLPIDFIAPKEAKEKKPKKKMSTEHKKFILEAVKNKKNENNTTQRN